MDGCGEGEAVSLESHILGRGGLPTVQTGLLRARWARWFNTLLNAKLLDLDPVAQGMALTCRWRMNSR